MTPRLEVVATDGTAVPSMRVMEGGYTLCCGWMLSLDRHYLFMQQCSMNTPTWYFGRKIQLWRWEIEMALDFCSHRLVLVFLSSRVQENVSLWQWFCCAGALLHFAWKCLTLQWFSCKCWKGLFIFFWKQLNPLDISIASKHLKARTGPHANWQS